MIFVAQNVTDAFDLLPREIGLACQNFIRQASARFRYDFDAPLDGVLDGPLAFKIVVIPACKSLLDPLDRFHNMPEGSSRLFHIKIREGLPLLCGRAYPDASYCGS